MSKVKLYALSTCVHCKKTKRLLDSCDVSYQAVDVDLLSEDEKQAVLQEIKSLNERCSFPTIVINDKVIVGYKETEIKEALGIK